MRTDPLRTGSGAEDAVADGLHQFRGDVGDAVVGGGVAGHLGQDAVLVGGREPGAATGDDVAAGEGLHEGLLVRGEVERPDHRGPEPGDYRACRAEARSSRRSRPSTVPVGSVTSTGSKRWAGGRVSARWSVSAMS